MRIIFLGGNEFSLESLKSLVSSNNNVVGVVCQPDKPNKRGKGIEFCPVKKFALEKGIDVFQFEKIRNGGAEVLAKLKPDILVVASYGQILSSDIINLAPFGTINVHASLLPKYRGSSPIISAILNGESETGITIMRIVEKVDAGDMLLQKSIKIFENETAGQLAERLSVLGAQMIIEAIEQLENGTAKETPQKEEDATFTKMIKKEDGLLDFSCLAKEVYNKVRAFNPNPGAFVLRNGEKIRIYKTEVVVADEKIKNGEIVCCSQKEGIVVKCFKDAIKILELQVPGGKILDWKSFLNGRKF